MSVAKHCIYLTPRATPVQWYYTEQHQKSANFISSKSLGVWTKSCWTSLKWIGCINLVFPEKYRTLCFFVDYWRMNASSQRGSYPIHRKEHCIDSFEESTVFTVLDGNSWYWHVRIDNKEKDKTVLTPHRNLYRFTRIPFRLKNALRIFKRAMDGISAPVK